MDRGPTEAQLQATQARKVAPFLKWAGGKRWFVQGYAHLFPKEFARYVEPFLGSAAAFFHLAPRSAVLADKNEELIDTYCAIRDDHDAVLRRLRFHQRNHSSSHYYLVRSQQPRTPASQAARFIYLNRTCWNGLYRVNRKGIFNVPIGTKEKVLLPTDDFAAVAKLLSNASLRTASYIETISDSQRGDFLFVDPPYVTKRHNGSFIKYNEKLFSWSDQIALHESLVQAKKRGAKILATNADNRLIRKLYECDFEVTTASRPSVISGDVISRGKCSELVIRS